MDNIDDALDFLTFCCPLCGCIKFTFDERDSLIICGNEECDYKEPYFIQTDAKLFDGSEDY